MKLKNLSLYLLTFLVAVNASAYEIYVRGKQEVTITKPIITLSDIASIDSTKNNLDEVIIGVGKTFIQNSPMPNKEVSIPANRIVEIMKNEGLKLEKIGYVFPKNIKVKRAGRLLTEKEVLKAITDYFDSEQREISVKRIYMKEDIFVSPDDLFIEVASFSKEPFKKDMGSFLLKITSGNGDVQKATINALIEEWKDVPVASRQIYRGEVVNEGDFVMARMNVSKLPKESFDVKKEIVGKEATRNISKGDIFSNTTLVSPPVVRNGDKIKIVYETPLLSAIVTGVALQDGAKQEKIKIKNDSSNKILEGYVMAQGLVRVN